MVHTTTTANHNTSSHHAPKKFDQLKKNKYKAIIDLTPVTVSPRKAGARFAAQSVLANSILGEIYFGKKRVYSHRIAVPKASHSVAHIEILLS